jgi:hypothetical protein
MSQADLMIEMPRARSEHTSSSSFAVLIAVPEIQVRSRTDRQQMPQPHMRVPRHETRRARRRLRREVRFAGYVLLVLVPIASACTLGWSNRPDRILACSIADPLQTTASIDSSTDILRLGGMDQSPQPTIASMGTVTLSSKPVVTIPEAVVEAPVIFPGYVLPDDSREDSLHEGS